MYLLGFGHWDLQFVAGDISIIETEKCMCQPQISPETC